MKSAGSQRVPITPFKYASSDITANVNGLYQFPWDITISANINYRDGLAFPQGYTATLADEDGFTHSETLAYNSFSSTKGDSVFVTDLKLSKTFHMGGRTKVEIAAELFNAFNEDTVLTRELNLASTKVQDPREVLSPRVGRFSATVHF